MSSSISTWGWRLQGLVGERFAAWLPAGSGVQGEVLAGRALEDLKGWLIRFPRVFPAFGADSLRASIAQGDDQEFVGRVEDLGQFPLQAFQLARLEATAEDAELNASSVTFEGFGGLSQPFGFANVVSDQVPTFSMVDHLSLMRAKRPGWPVHSFSRSRTSSSMSRA